MRLVRDDPGLPLYNTTSPKGHTFRRIRARARHVSFTMFIQNLGLNFSVVFNKEYADESLYNLYNSSINFRINNNM